jgi:multiple sugar transport system substrate-binding protein
MTVKYNVIPSDQFLTKLPILFASKQDVDIINIHDRYIAAYLDQLSTAPDYVEEDIAKNAPSSYKMGQMNGKTYGYLYPVAHIAFVNKTMFKEAGLEYPKTWDDVLAINKAMTKKVKVDGKDVQKNGVNLWWGSGQGMFTTAYWNNLYSALGGTLLPEGGGKIEVNNETAIKATQMFKDLSYRDGSFLTDFAAGNVAYMLGASWCTPYFKANGVKGLDFDIIQVPAGISGTPVAQGYFQIVTVPNWRPQEVQDAAWKFNFWAHNDENNYILETVGGVGDWRLDTMKRLGDADPLVKAAYDAAPYATSPLIHEKWADIERIICDWVEKCVYDKVSAADAMAGAQAELDKTLGQ